MSDPRTALFEAIRADDPDAVRGLLEGSPELADAVDEDGLPALKRAIADGHTRAAVALLQSGARADAGDLAKLIELDEDLALMWAMGACKWQVRAKPPPEPDAG